MTHGPDNSWFDRIPKAELHLHLEGAIPHDTLWQLIQKYGGDATTPDRASLAQRFEYRDFPHFIETWTWKNQFLREYEDFTLIARAVANDLADQNIRYAEVFYSPPDFARRGLRPQRITEAIRNGLDAVDRTTILLVADLVRDFGPSRALRTLEEVGEVKQLGVAGIGIGGSEHDFPPGPFEGVFARARDLGLHTSAHAGEALGAESIWGAIRSLHVDRIGHGTRAGEDEELVEYLVQQQLPVEMCPISNVRTGIVESYERHPVRRFFEQGVNLCINTDDPKMFGNTLACEYQQLVERMGFSKQEIRQLVLNAVLMSWTSAEHRRALIAQFRDDPAWDE